MRRFRGDAASITLDRGEELRRVVVPLLGLAIMTELVITLLILPEFEWTGLVVVIFTIANGAVGVLLVTRLRGHPIGWLLLVASAAAATGALAVTYVQMAVTHQPGSLYVSYWVIWLGELAFLLAVTILSTFLLLLFPSGRLGSSRWRVVIGLAALGTLMMGAGRILSPESFDRLPISNPLALPEDHFLLLLVEGGGFYLLTLTILLSLWSLSWRYRHGSKLERQQLKLAVFGMAIATIGPVGPAVFWRPSQVCRLLPSRWTIL